LKGVGKGRTYFARKGEWGLSLQVLPGIQKNCEKACSREAGVPRKSIRSWGPDRWKISPLGRKKRGKLISGKYEAQGKEKGVGGGGRGDILFSGGKLRTKKVHRRSIPPEGGGGVGLRTELAYNKRRIGGGKLEGGVHV